MRRRPLASVVLAAAGAALLAMRPVGSDDSVPEAAAAVAAAAAAAAVVDDLAQLQRAMLAGGAEDRRAVLCKTVAGLGNRIQGIISCLALAVATRRALVVQWEREISTTPPHANGLMPCGLDDVIAFPDGLDLNESRAYERGDEARVQVVEAYVSQMVLRSGRGPSWGDLLLCTNLTHVLQHTPVLAVPAWRWMPEILSNAAYRDTMERLFSAGRSGPRGADPPAFYRTVAPLFIRPAPAVVAAAAALRRYWPGRARAIGLQVRVGLGTDNEAETQHFFTPAKMWRSWLRCAYSALSVLGSPEPAAHNAPPAGAEAGPEVWFIAADSTEVKVAMLLQLAREEGGVLAELNLGRVTTPSQRDALLQGMTPGQRASSSEQERARGVQIPGTGHAWVDDGLAPVVVDFASGVRLVFFGRDASRVGCEDVQAAMLEMHVLSWSRVLVASHLSTFAALPAASVAPAGIYHVNRDGDCFNALSLDPLSDAGDLFRTAECFSERHVVHHSWSRPRRRSVRQTRRQ